MNRAAPFAWFSACVAVIACSGESEFELGTQHSALSGSDAAPTLSSDVLTARQNRIRDHFAEQRERMKPYIVAATTTDWGLLQNGTGTLTTPSDEPRCYDMSTPTTSPTSNRFYYGGPGKGGTCVY